MSENNFNLKKDSIPFYFLEIGIAWTFALFIWFGGSLKQRHLTHFGKLENFRSLNWSWYLQYQIERNTVIKIGPSTIIIYNKTFGQFNESL